ncbi:hypothetical protein [Aquipseudomonas alcaligenes]|uniref:hypothetical protein n=1 Tax=Aquipseudomonas alcaligenes TaxID=43263 RepID=UPI00077FFC6B|nr:hypothetical protein [Pseudomonas alcaligenes]AMR66726.1 hypothetical protein A0T30_10290 [Pseudomonas alcaligenes]
MSTENRAVSEERKPYKRDGRNIEMDLPAGKTCGDCVHCRRCTQMFGHIPEDEVCDWAPSRFTPKALPVQEQQP